MDKLAQLGIVVIALGGILALIGLFPGVIGLEQVAGVGLVQILVILLGFSIMVSGAFIYVHSTYYHGMRYTLGQQIAIRLSMTGMILSTVCGLADMLGFGSHPLGGAARPLLGTWQTAGMVGGFVIASVGVIIFALISSHTPTEAR